MTLQAVFAEELLHELRRVVSGMSKGGRQREA
jgi:hypothetical protein